MPPGVSANGHLPGTVEALNPHGLRTDFELSDSELVRDVLYACQGLNGHYIKYRTTAEGGLGGYEVDATAGIPLPQRQLLARLCELGWLFRKVEAQVGGKLGISGGEGAIRQAFQSALRRELSSLFQLLAVLESMASQPLPTKGKEASTEGREKGYLTLRRLVVWLGEARSRLRCLAVLADSVTGLPGAQLVAALAVHSLQGQPLLRATVQRCVDAACAPLLEMTWRWLFEGHLSNAPGDFFIVAATHLHERTGALWREGYHLEESMRPPFISEGLGRKILRGGKSVNFLRDCCGDSDWVQDRLHTALATCARSLSPSQMGEVEGIVEAAVAGIDRHVTATLLNKYRFGTHCDAIKRYLLMGQGDFIQALMEAVGTELSRRAVDISEYTLSGCLDAALRASSAQYDDPDITSRLRIKLDRATAHELGWDVFTLRYDVEEPLATVLSEGSAEAYLRVFRLLWALKRAEHSLSSCWALLNAQQHLLNRLPMYERRYGLSCPGVEEVYKELRQCHALRSEMAHLCTNLQSYVMFEVLERAWNDFMRDLASVSNLDSLIGAHARYQQVLLGEALLENEQAGVQTALQLLLASLLLLQAPLRRLHLLVEEAVTEVARRARQMMAREAGGKWSTVESDAPLRGIPAAEVAEVREFRRKISAEYAQHQAAFVSQLAAQAPLNLNFLIFRLEAAGEKPV